MNYLVPFDASMLKPDDWELSESETWDGRPAVMISRVAGGIDGQQADFRTEYWISPDCGYAIVRQRQFRRGKSDQEWSEMLSTSCSGHVVHEFDIWLPTKGKSRLITSGSDITTVYTFSDWNLKEEPKAADLQLDFPEGTRVIDRMPKASSPQTIR